MSVLETSRKMTSREQTAYDLGFHEGRNAAIVHGRWGFGTANHREYMKCSVCLKSQTPTGVFTYCPSCGAKMDGDQ